jgi:hypothetical protein
MAQDNWINITVDPSVAKKPDNADHRHTVVPGTGAAGDFTISWDSTKVTSQSVARSLIAKGLQLMAGYVKQ